MEEMLSALEHFTIGDVLDFEEKYDEQFHALKYLAQFLEPKRFLSLVIANALISYQLNCKGERYWWEFARFFMKNKSRGIIDAFTEFLDSSLCNKRLINQKLSRLRKVVGLLDRYSGRIDWLVDHQEEFSRKLAVALGVNPSAKTVVFAAKMINYALRIIKRRKIVAPMSIDIPVDSRITKITKKIGNDDPIVFWRKISKLIKIPPLHIDSLLWVSFRLAGEDLSLLGDKKVLELVRVMKKLFEC